ncbi:MAG: hypothetical protein HRU47_01555, partial [Verrucomicrobiales bacterium]|nr:hypothetical protein [Verrucomicrobiales bacterium]
MFKYVSIIFLLSSLVSNAAVTWTGNAGTDIFDGGNYSGLANGVVL